MQSASKTREERQAIINSLRVTFDVEIQHHLDRIERRIKCKQLISPIDGKINYNIYDSDNLPKEVIDIIESELREKYNYTTMQVPMLKDRVTRVIEISWV